RSGRRQTGLAPGPGGRSPSRPPHWPAALAFSSLNLLDGVSFSSSRARGASAAPAVREEFPCFLVPRSGRGDPLRCEPVSLSPGSLWGCRQGSFTSLLTPQPPERR